MAEAKSVAEIFYAEWKKYQDDIRNVVAPLTAEQLTLRPAPHLRSIGELVEHIVATRVGWFTGVLGEGADDIKQLSHYGVEEEVIRTAGELANDLDITWQMMMNKLAGWSEADLLQEVEVMRQGQKRVWTRAWVIYHLMEHDIHHGGELSFLLGIHHIPALDLSVK